MAVRLALKVDADTDRGTRVGIPNLAADCAEFGATLAAGIAAGIY